MPKEGKSMISVSGSFLSAEQMKLFKETSKALGRVQSVKGIELNECDFLVVGQDKVKRSVKVLRSMVKGINIVNTKWVTDSRTKGEWIINPNPEHMACQQCTKIFSGMTVQVSDPLAIHLIQNTGGKISKDNNNKKSIKIDTSQLDLIYESIFTNSLSSQLTKRDSNVQLDTNPPPKPLHTNTPNNTTQSQLSLDLLMVSGGIASDKSGHPYLKLQVAVTEGTVPKQILLNKSTITVGRKQKYNDIMIETSQISRKHAVFTQSVDGTVTIADCGSTNGFFVNGVKRDKWTLTDGDIIILGGGGVTQAGWKAEEIPSDCIYRYHSTGGLPEA